MAKWEEVVAGAITGGLSLVGVPWQQHLQKELMHENAAINIAQWNRENEYNSPKAQMQRLREAGLNPDLAIGGNVANTASSMSPTEGTPAAPFASSAVANALDNARQAAMAQSQIDLNEANAKNAEASAGEHDANTAFKNTTLQASYNSLLASIDATKQQIRESQARIDLYNMQAEHFLVDISLMRTRQMNLDAERLFTKERTRSEMFNNSMLFKRVQRYDEILNAELSETISRIGLNDAQAAGIRANTSLLWATYQSQVSWWSHHAAAEEKQADMFNSMSSFYQSQGKYFDLMVQYFPLMNAKSLFEAEQYFKRDKDGNFILDKNGKPQVRKGYAGFMRIMDCSQSVLNCVESLSRSFMNVGIGIGGIKGFGSSPSSDGGFYQSSSSNSYQDYIFRPQETPPSPDYSEYDAALKRYHSASPGKDKEKAYKELMKIYNKMHR